MIESKDIFNHSMEYAAENIERHDISTNLKNIIEDPFFLQIVSTLLIDILLVLLFVMVFLMLRKYCDSKKDLSHPNQLK